MLFKYLLIDSESVRFVPIITGITFVSTVHIGCVSIVRSLCSRIFLASYLITFPSPEIAASINIYVFVKSRTIMFFLLLLLLFLRYFVYEPEVNLFPTRNITVVITPNSYDVTTTALKNTAKCSSAQH
jgi:hypothetical protein